MSSLLPSIYNLTGIPYMMSGDNESYKKLMLFLMKVPKYYQINDQWKKGQKYTNIGRKVLNSL